MRFDFTDLHLFRHIVEAGSITHGAARSNLALAAASTRIRKMELAFGTALLVRGRAGVTPTPAGRTLLQHARGILAQTERLQEDLMPYARGLAGQVRVLSNTNALTEFLPESLSSFLMAYPDISVDLEERLSDEIVGLIAEGNADIGIVAGTVDYAGLILFPSAAIGSYWSLRKIIRSRADRVSVSPKCSTTTWWGWIAPVRSSAFLRTKRIALAGHCVCASSYAASMQSAAWLNAMLAWVLCRRRRCSAPSARWRLRRYA